MKEGKPVRIGVVGLGSFGLLHAETIHAIAECQLAVVVDCDAKRLTEAGRWPETIRYQDLQEAIDNTQVDGWIIATSSSSHIPVARQILTAGGRVMIEKPLARSIVEAESIADLVLPDSSNVMLGHIVLFGSEFRMMVRATQNRSPIRFIDSVRHRPQSTMDAFPNESPFHLTMVHDLYCVQVLKQRAEPIDFSTQTCRDISGRVNLAMAQLRFDDGSIASLKASFLTPPGMPEDGFDRIEVFGSDWAARVTANPRPFEFWDSTATRPATLEIDNEFGTGMLAEELRHFCRVLRGESDVPIGATYRDALQIQRWLERMTVT